MGSLAENKPISVEGVMLLCRERLALDSKVSKSYRREAAWAYVEDKFLRAIADGKIPASDKRDAAGLASKFSREQSQFRFLTKKMQEAAESGASRDDLEDVVLCFCRCASRAPPPPTPIAALTCAPPLTP